MQYVRRPEGGVVSPEAGSSFAQMDLGAGTELESFERAVRAHTHLCAQTFCILPPA